MAIAVDRRKAAQSGLTEMQVGQSVATALRGSTAGTVTIGGVAQAVVVRAGAAPGDLAARCAPKAPTAANIEATPVKPAPPWHAPTRHA